MRKDDMTPEVRIDRNLLRICNAAGIPITHCTEEQLAVMREEMRSIMKESYIKGSNDHYDALVKSGRLRK